MEDNNHQWYDPLLLTDVSMQESHSYQDVSSSQSSLRNSSMADPSQFYCNTNQGRSMLGFSLTSPDLVICGGSPDIPGNNYGNSPESLKYDHWKNMKSSTEISLEKGINGSEDTDETPPAKLPTLWKTSKEFVSPEASFELLPQTAVEDDSLKGQIPVVSINAGSTDGAVVLAGSNYSEDNYFNGGDTIRTDAIIGDGEALPLYQTARFGNFSYVFQHLEPGNYAVDLHFAEIIFTDGPPGMRVFDVFIQEQKAVSCIDIYAHVGANRPLVISDLKTFVDEEKILTIRFEGVCGSAIVCGILLREDSHASSREVESFKFMGMSEMPEFELPKDSGDTKQEGELQKLQRENEFQKKELTETKRTLVELKRENQLKSRECQEAWNSLKELQNELMRKSMHVGSLAFAIEGQVKEKGKWFSSLRDLTRKLKILKMEHIKLLEEASDYTKCLAYIDELSSTIQLKISHQVELHEDLKVKYVEGAKERKELYNKYLDLKGNIRVFCRCRPLNTEEIDSGASMPVDFESAKDGELTVKSNGTIKKTFKFDAVFCPQADQIDVFQDTAPVATSVLDGYNVCIFAYGQTGTGKTFTMEGTDEARGVNFRTLEELFCIIKERQALFRYDVSVSVLEVYNEQIRDLLVSGTQPGVGTKRLEIRQVGEGVHHVPGLVEAHVNNISEVWEVLQTGSNARAVGSTNANEHSSRSHCIHCVMVKGENLVNGECTRSKLWLVDLAGSERIAKSEVQGDRLKETQNINRSLSALGDVISSLASKSPHVPFRNSKLTHLLQDSLGGDSKTLMFVQISPNENDMTETLCSLNFASRVRGIELGPAKKQLDTTEFLKNKQMVEKTKQDMKSKDVQIKKMEDTIYGLDFKIKERDLKNKNLQDKVKELESQLLIERKLARQHVDTKIAEQHQQQLQQVKQQQEEHTCVPLRPPLGNRPLGLYKNFNESPIGTLGRDQVNLAHPLTENNSYKPPTLLPPTDGIAKCIDPTEKENNPEMAEQPAMLPKRTGRASICTTARRIPFIPPVPSRRNSLIPFPNNAPNLAHFPTTLLPLPPFQADKKEDIDGPESNCLPEQSHTESPKGLKSGGKKISSILRRSLQRKVQIKSPLMHHQYGRKGGINVGMEKVRLSIGTRGRMAHRVLVSNYRKAGAKDVIQQQKLSQKERERPWNTGTAGRTVL